MKALFVLASGLGNSILLSPTIKRLAETRPEASIHLYVYREEFAEPYRGSNFVDHVHVQHGLQTLFALRREAFDVSFCGFPSNRWQFHVLTRLIASHRRIAHDYPVGYWRTYRFLETDLVPARPDLHDVEQNLQLLKPLEITEPASPELLFHLNADHRAYASTFLEQQDLRNRHLIGIHPGSGPLTWKRAPLSEFVEQITQRAQSSSHVLVFGGPDEDVLKDETTSQIRQETSLNCTRIDTNLKQTAALISECDLFLSNDSGLSHVATAVDVPSQVTFFNGTDPTRTRPWRDDAELIHLRSNVMNYPFKSTTAP